MTEVSVDEDDTAPEDAPIEGGRAAVSRWRVPLDWATAHPLITVAVLGAIFTIYQCWWISQRSLPRGNGH